MVSSRTRSSRVSCCRNSASTAVTAGTAADLYESSTDGRPWYVPVVRTSIAVGRSKRGALSQESARIDDTVYVSRGRGARQALAVQ